MMEKTKGEKLFDALMYLVGIGSFILAVFIASLVLFNNLILSYLFSAISAIYVVLLEVRIIILEKKLERKNGRTRD